VNALASIGAPSVPLLIAAFHDDDPVIMNSLTEALFLIGSPAVPHLIQLLGDPGPGVRRRAALLLGEIGDPGAIEPLRRILTDEESTVRREAFEALEQIKRMTRC
jgi:HEAT repeat protein